MQIIKGQHHYQNIPWSNWGVCMAGGGEEGTERHWTEKRMQEEEATDAKDL